ncbi:aspartyl/asparaginyl beta-hydroxylase [Nitzschia inconspicua]|uniref:Aspartyl/asparaginyl beta-hydroxylase n=1 Tax=Nitzschia inconspicua TaxID=303405 RepID=A0A9K3LRV7_9STRA|nr:aspartyl/asparaginyl beta-hydroxylase [Nitzschia inconspicua]
MVHGLPSKEIVTSLHKDTCQYLREQSTRELVMSALQSTATPYWTVNDSPEGHWEVLHLLNQGTWNKVLFAEGQNGSSAWNDVLSLVRNIPGLMNECLFGNVMISKIHSGTTIEPHCGPTNVRHRLQFLLEMASEDKLKMSMLIGRDKQVFWNSVDNIFVFDDSYVHSVTYPQTKNGAERHEDHALTRTRTVLIVDLWNPYLSSMERLLLQQLYPRFATQDAVKSS